MDVAVDFAGGMKIQARFNAFTVLTDQAPSNGGEGSAPDPYSFFLVSLVTCAGFYVMRFCQSRNIATDDIRLTMRNDWNPEKGCPDHFFLDIHLPADFPPKYTQAVIRATQECTVKKTLNHPPEFVINTHIGDEEASA